MSILHGSWLKKAGESYLFLWGETWRTGTGIEGAAANTSVPVNPFSLNRQEFFAFIQSRHLEREIDGDRCWQQQTIVLPSFSRDRGKFILPITSQQLPTDRSEILLASWQVEGICLNSLETVKMLRQFPLNCLPAEANYIGGDLQFWTHIYRWILDLSVRGKFLPAIERQPEGRIEGHWYPVLDSKSDRSRLAKFEQGMPPACLAYQCQQSGELPPESQELLLDFLRNILDAQIRDWLAAVPSLHKTTIKQPWLQSLREISAKFLGTEAEFKRLETASSNWSLPLQEYIVKTGNKQIGKNQFSTCFKLASPRNTGKENENWKLDYYLQALDDQSLLINASTIWQNPVEILTYKNRQIEQPQESFLKGLGLASHVYSPIAESLQQPRPEFCELNPIQVYEFIRAIAWQLQDRGLEVILPDSLAAGAEQKRLGLQIEAEVNTQKGDRLSLKSLLNYNLKLTFGGENISAKDFERLLDQKSPIVEINGEWIALQPADVRAAQAILKQVQEPIHLTVEDALRLSTGDTQTIAKLPVIKFQASGVLEEFIGNLTDNQRIETIENPPGFRGKLRPYQARGVGWLAFLERWSLGACLADDMGLGKTPQLIAFLLHLKAAEMLTKPVLVVCPTSVLNNWEREVKKFAPTLSTLIHHGDKRDRGKTFIRKSQSKDLVITSYSLLYRDAQILEEFNWQGIVLDEAQNIKNPQAKQSQAVRKLKAGFRIALTGTPVENHLSELWSILDFLNPGFLGNQQFFQRRFATPIEKYGDRESLQMLRSLVQPFILRRLKTDRDIVDDLPEKQEINVFCGLSLEQASIYEKIVTESLSEIEETSGIQRKGQILTLLLKLKQICNHPAQFLKQKSLVSSERSGKLMRLEEMLEELIDEGDRALIFTQFAEWGKLVKPYLANKFNREVLFLYGGTPRPKRQEMIDRFQDDPDGPPILILSLKAGGTGLNLTRANHVFHFDRWWNPAVENQATDRAFRLGQKRNVQVYKFVCTGTLEEKINDMLESKKQLAEQTVSAGEQWLTEMDGDRLRNLLLLDREAIIDE